MESSLLDSLCSELTLAAETLQRLYNINSNGLANHHDFGVPSVGGEQEVLTAQRNLNSIVSRLQTLLGGPQCLISRLAEQNQLLACLKWLGEFQVIACVPFSGSISIQELADLADVPETILSRVVRMTATAGFLHEPQPGYIAHTPLSASFTTDLSHFDAAMFLANTIAPSALNLTLVSHKGDAKSPLEDKTAYMAAHSTPLSFASSCTEGSQLCRQWSAYSQSLGIGDDSLAALLDVLNWKSLGGASIVHVCSRYSESSRTLAQLSPGLQVIVQAYDITGSEPESQDSISNRIKIQMREPVAPQTIKDAAVYFLQPSLSPLSPESPTMPEIVVAELRSHLGILRANPSALLILAPPLLPEPGSVDINSEVRARLHDFLNLQLTSGSALEVTELFKLVESVCDAHGMLIVNGRLRSITGATIALTLKYQSFTDNNQIMV